MAGRGKHDKDERDEQSYQGILIVIVQDRPADKKTQIEKLVHREGDAQKGEDQEARLPSGRKPAVTAGYRRRRLGKLVGHGIMPAPLSATARTFSHSFL